MCKDARGNVFLADNNNDRICLLTPDGHYARDVLTISDGISKPKSLTIDGCGNLWILMGTYLDQISVFSYL
jgi:sugar lactone lactonase YvrE